MLLYDLTYENDLQTKVFFKKIPLGKKNKKNVNIFYVFFYIITIGRGPGSIMFCCKCILKDKELVLWQLPKKLLFYKYHEELLIHCEQTVSFDKKQENIENRRKAN